MSERKEDVAFEAKRGAMARLLSSIKSLVDPELPVEDRRIAGRLDCALETSYVTETGETGTATVLDVSRRGLRLNTGSALSKGITVALKPPAAMLDGGYAPLMAKVMWSTKDKQGWLSGVLLPPGIEDEETWLEAFLHSRGYTRANEQRRKYTRAESELPGRLLIDEDHPVEVLVLNLSMGGALLRADRAFEKTTPFRLQLGPRGDLPELELTGAIIGHAHKEGDSHHFHSTRFGPLEERRHTLLKEYILKLLKKR